MSIVKEEVHCTNDFSHYGNERMENEECNNQKQLIKELRLHIMSGCGKSLDIHPSLIAEIYFLYFY